MTAAPNLLVLGDYPVDFANGIGETLGNLLDGLPADRLVQVFPSYLKPNGRLRGTAVRFEFPRPPADLPALGRRLYHPWLKARQWSAEHDLTALAAEAISRHRIGAVLTYPVTPWVLFAAVRLRRAFPAVRFVFYVMDDWEGHHTCFGLPFTAKRRAALEEIVATADARFACSYRMRDDYERRFACRWQVLHKGVPRPRYPDTPRPMRQPWRIVYAGGMNVFRADAVLAFAAGLRRFRESTGHAATLTLLGAANDRASVPELTAHDFVYFEPWIDNAQCQLRLADADLLYLPLSFLPRVERIAHLAMPTKFGEYLATGRPVIFHVPSSSEVCDLATRAGLPLTLTTVDPDAICRRLIDLDREGVDLVDYQARARRLLDEEFDESVLRSRLRSALSPAEEQVA
jgi:hypothetical protein